MTWYQLMVRHEIDYDKNIGDIIYFLWFIKLNHFKMHLLYLGNMNLSHFGVGGVVQSLYHTSWVATISLGGWKRDPQPRPIRGRLLIFFECK